MNGWVDALAERPELWAVIAVLLVLTVAVNYVRRAHIRVFSGSFVYVAATDDGALRLIDRTCWLLNWRWFILTKRRLGFVPQCSIYNEDTDSFEYRELVNGRTGAISLQENTCVPKPFSAKSVDGYSYQVKPRIRFRLKQDAESIFGLLGNRDFDLGFKSRIEAACRESISKRDDKKIAGERKQIHDEVRDALREREDEAPLHIEFLEIALSLVKASPTISTSGEGADEFGGGAMEHTVARLDELRDHFVLQDLDTTGVDEATRLRHFELANMCLISMLELQSRQNCVQSLVGAGNLFVLSTDDIGISAQHLLRDKFRGLSSSDATAMADASRKSG